MDMSTTIAPTRHDGWTPARKVQFLEALAQDGNVRAACARVGLSAEAAYRLRRRDPLFARAWAAAQLQARPIVGEVLGTRAIEGVEEQIWYRGELRGTQRRYDSRLLLAHMLRLDKLAEDEGALEDAGRFDELLACIAGQPIPEALAQAGGELPLSRDAAVARMAERVEPGGTEEEFDAACGRAAGAGAALWDGWFAGVCQTVDRLLDEADAGPAAFTPRTLSTVSTSALASALLAGQRAVDPPPPEDQGDGPPQSGSANT